MSVHDNILKSYTVDGDAKRIVLCTEYPHDDPPTRTDVVFTGVVDHYFRNSVFPSIIFEVEAVALRDIIERDKQLIDSDNRIGGWPSFWRETVDEMVLALSNDNIQMFEISSSYGLDGWVAAKDCEFTEFNGN